MVRKYSEYICTYCDNPPTEGKGDHVPPLCIYPKPRPSNLITVPACITCNDKFGKDDEYFWANMAFAAPMQIENIDEVRKRWLKMMQGRGGAVDDIRNHIVEKHIYAVTTGLYLGKIHFLNSIPDRLHNIVNRIARGLYRDTTGHRLPLNVQVSCRAVDTEFKYDFLESKLGFYETGKKTGAGDVFEYKYGISSDNPYVSTWAFKFYGIYVYWVFTGIDSISHIADTGDPTYIETPAGIMLLFDKQYSGAINTDLFAWVKEYPR